MRLLDVGCGPGSITRGFAERLSPGQVIGLDLSKEIVAAARQDAAARGLANLQYEQGNVYALPFPDTSFDVVYAPYVISVVPDPVAVTREMHRVCRPGGKIIILNHFLSPNPVVAWFERAISPFTVHIGFKSDLDLPAFLAQAELKPVSIEKVNIPRIWSLVTCIKA